MRALEADAREVVPEDVVGLLEGAPRDREGRRHRPPHADLLRPLTREKQRDQSRATQQRNRFSVTPDSSCDGD